MAGVHGRPAESDNAAPFQQAVKNGRCEVGLAMAALAAADQVGAVGGVAGAEQDSARAWLE